MCKGMEVTAIRMITHWRPLHAKIITSVRLVKHRLTSLIKTCSVRIIQRSVKKRLLMYVIDPKVPYIMTYGLDQLSCLYWAVVYICLCHKSVCLSSKLIFVFLSSLHIRLDLVLSHLVHPLTLHSAYPFNPINPIKHTQIKLHHSLNTHTPLIHHPYITTRPLLQVL